VGGSCEDKTDFLLPPKYRINKPNRSVMQFIIFPTESSQRALPSFDKNVFPCYAIYVRTETFFRIVPCHEL